MNKRTSSDEAAIIDLIMAQVTHLTAGGRYALLHRLRASIREAEQATDGLDDLRGNIQDDALPE